MRNRLKFNEGDFDYFFGVGVGVVLGAAIGLWGLLSLAIIIVITGLWNHYDW